MSTKTQEEGTAAYAALPKEQQKTCDTYLHAYRLIRLEEGPFFYISRAAVAKKQGSNSISGAITYMAIIEPMEGDQPRRRSGKSKASAQNQTSSSQQPTAVQSALDGVRTALEAVSKAVADARSAADAELSAHFQATLREQQALFDSDRQADEARIEDFEKSAAVASDECLQANATIEDLREKLQAAAAARDAATTRAEQDTHALQLVRAQFASAEALVAVLKQGAAVHSGEVLRLQKELQAQEGAVADGINLRAENRALAERAGTLADQIGRQDAFISDMERRHEAERAAIRTVYDRQLAEERQRSNERETRLMAWGAIPASPTHEGERG